MGRMAGIGPQELAEQAVITSKLADSAVIASKLGVALTTFISQRAYANSLDQGTAYGPLGQGAGSTDLVGASVAFTPADLTRKVSARLYFSGFIATATGNISVRLLVDGVVTGQVFVFAYNTLSQHQSWGFQWTLPAGTVPAGAHTIKVQIQMNVANATFNKDANDYTTFEVGEVN